jgi:hypothetical protein
MDKNIRKFTKPTDLGEIEAEEYWQSRPMHEQMEAVSGLTSAYGIKETDVPRLDKTLVRIERPPRRTSDPAV